MSNSKDELPGATAPACNTLEMGCRTNTFPARPVLNETARFNGINHYPPSTVRGHLHGYTVAEQDVLNLAVRCGLQFSDTAAILALVRELVGDINKRPLIWIMETDAVPVSHTHYQQVAEEYSKRPAYTVTAIYPHRVRP